MLSEKCFGHQQSIVHVLVLSDHAGQEANEALLQENKRLRGQIDDLKVSILSTKWKNVSIGHRFPRFQLK
jgi:hypothetical protein